MAETEIEIEARAAMKKHHLRPLEHPMGDDHHTDAAFTQADHEIGELAYWLGGIFIDKQEDCDPATPLKDTYWYNEMSSLDIWTRVARALRVHGLKIVNVTSPDTSRASDRDVLVEALRPFAAAAEDYKWLVYEPDAGFISEASGVTVGDLRRARAALSAIGAAK